MVETLEHLVRTMSTVEDLQSIVRTMKALAAVSIRQYERAVGSLKAYNRTMDLGLHVVLRHVRYPTRPTDGRGVLGAIVFGSDHGLCGRFNEDLATFVGDHVRSRAEVDSVRLLAVGARMTPRLEEADLPVDTTLPVAGSAARITATVRAILEHIDRWGNDDVTSVHLFYNRRRSGAMTRQVAQRLLPVDLHRLRTLEEEPWPSSVLPTFSMPGDRLFAALVRQHLFAMVFRACAESQAAEHASRLQAMQSAERSLDDRHLELLGEFRRRRQQVITSELLDVVAGYEALRTSKEALTAGSEG